MKYICPDCGKQYETGKFCLECGAKLQELVPELVCPSCGFKAKSGKFCPECGTKLEEQYGASAVAAKSDDPERKFNERDPRFAKYYGKDGFLRTMPQEERAVAIEELTPFAEQNIAEAKMLLGFILFVDPDSAKDGLSLLKEAEAAGDMFAYYIMGLGFLYGLEPVVNQDIDEAEKRLLELNKEYDGEANDTLAELYAFYKIDYKKAFQYATAAAEEDVQGGYKILGDLYLNGWGVTENAQKAFDNYKMAAAFGDAVAMNQIGWLYRGNEEGFEADPEQAFYWYNESAKKGSDVGMYNVGFCYQNGIGVKKDDEIAAEWFKKAAELGNVGAMNELGDYYQNVLIDLDKAESWYRKGADLGDAECQNKLGVLLIDCEEANSWFQKAMEQNQPNAYNNYALNLWEGNGVAENKQKAIELKKKAIELGLEDEVNRLGVWYGQIGDDERANECFLKAINQEDPWGYYNYAWNLWNGTATEINKDKAIEFMTKAAEMGLEEAQADLEKWTTKVPDVGSKESSDSLRNEDSKSFCNKSVVEKITATVKEKGIISIDLWTNKDLPTYIDDLDIESDSYFFRFRNENYREFIDWDNRHFRSEVKDFELSRLTGQGKSATGEKTSHVFYIELVKKHWNPNAEEMESTEIIETIKFRVIIRAEFHFLHKNEFEIIESAIVK